MKRRITRFPIVQVALVAVSLLVGFALAPVAAQTAAGLDGQVTVRSDGAVYLVSGGQRHWVATVVITDDEANAYPEAEPVYSALAPFGGGGSSASASAAPPKPAASPAPGAPAASAPPASAPPAAGSSTSTTPAGPPPTPDPNAMAAPVGGACPADKQVKGATQNGIKYYWEPDRPDYATITPDTCFTAGSYARDAGYKNSKQR